jgi:hypothetical protein
VRAIDPSGGQLRLQILRFLDLSQVMRQLDLSDQAT